MGFGGGSGGGSISGATDAALNNPTNGQGLLYETSTAKWRNLPVYTKPLNGIPEADLTSEVRDKLNQTASTQLPNRFISVEDQIIASDLDSSGNLITPGNILWDRALVEAKSSGVHFIYGGASEYFFAASVSLNGYSGVTLSGAGMSQTVISATQTGSAAAIIAFTINKGLPSGGVDTSDITIQNLGFDGSMDPETGLKDGDGNDVFARDSRVFASRHISCALRAVSTRDPATPNYPVVKNITIKDCRFVGLSALPIHLTGIYGWMNMTGCHIERCLDTGFTFCESVTFSDNFSYFSADNGVSLSRGNGVIVCDGNRIHGPWFSGIWIAGFSGDRAPENIVVSNNVITTVGQYGINALVAPKSVTITGNLIKDIRSGGANSADDYGSGIMIAGYNAGTDAAPDWKYAENITISGNSFEDCNRGGVNLFRYVTGVTIVGNLFKRMGTANNTDGSVRSDSNGYYNWAVANPGPYSEWGDTVSNVLVASNQIIDDRTQTFAGSTFPVTRYATWHPGIDSWKDQGNAVYGIRNSYSEQLNKSNLTLGDDSSSDSRLILNGASGQGKILAFQTTSLMRATLRFEGVNTLKLSTYSDDGTTGTDIWSVARNTHATTYNFPIVHAKYTTSTRPPASTTGAGAMIYDTTLGKPVWSNGTSWTDASGAVV